MRASVIIPVWNGASVLPECLDALYACAGDEMLECICVDNASHDESAALIAEHYPQARLLRQPVNLGFAGGVNAGFEAAQGDVFVLLNQDCIVQPDWLSSLVNVLKGQCEFGIVGCTILNVDGSVNHAGAFIRRPDAYGVHLTEIGSMQPRRADYVTGAVMAIRRDVWQGVGPFDEGFYPGYYEECDYCYRARRKGFEIIYVPQARVTHLLTGSEWKRDPIRHSATQHLSRYRFVCKHFPSEEMHDFFIVEEQAIEHESYFAQAMGRVLAAKQTLRTLADIAQRRACDLGETLSAVEARQLRVGFTNVAQQSLARLERLNTLITFEDNRFETVSAIDQSNVARTLKSLQQREHHLLTRIFFRSPFTLHAESRMSRLWRLLVLRPFSFLIGRDYLLLSELNAIHVARLDSIEALERVQEEQIAHLERRLRVLEMLADYEYC